MLDAVISGRVYRPAVERLVEGVPTTVAIVRACVRDGKPVLLEVRATGETPRAVLAKLARGDEAVIVGALTPRIRYVDTRPRLDLTLHAHRVIAGQHLEHLGRDDPQREPVFVYRAAEGVEVAP